MSKKLFLTLNTRIITNAPLDNLVPLAIGIPNGLINQYWKEETLNSIFEYNYAYKFFSESDFNINGLYLPSRFKRALFEKVGRTLKSQYQNMIIFNKIISKCPDLDWNLKEYSDISWYSVSMLLTRLSKYKELPNNFFEFQKVPQFNNFSLDYSVTDIQLIKIDYTTGNLKIKAPIPEIPEKATHWIWADGKIVKHNKLREYLNSYKVHIPELQLKYTKSGIPYYVLSIPFEPKTKKFSKKIKRVLGVDLGLKKIATLCILDKYLGQISTPFFIKSKYIQKLFKLKQESKALNNKLQKLRGKKQFKECHAYYKRVNRKFRDLLKQIAHLMSKIIVDYAIANKCDTIALEQIINKKKGDLIWQISNWLHSRIMDYVRYKAKLHGIRVKIINPNNTSRTCPRCGFKGFTCKSSESEEEIKDGSWFKCKNCNFNGDRDYIGALNIARVCLYKKLNKAKAVSYKESATLANPSVRAISQVDKNNLISAWSLLFKFSSLRCVIKCLKGNFGKNEGLKSYNFIY